MWVIQLDNARKVCEVALAAIPVLALSYLAADKEKFQLAKHNPHQTSNPAKDRLWNDATARLDATLGIVFALLTFVGMMAALFAVVTRPYVWTLAVVVLSIGLGLTFILLGVTVGLTMEIDAKRLPDTIPPEVALAPSKIASAVEFVFGMCAMVFFGLAAPVGVLVLSGLLLFNADIR